MSTWPGGDHERARQRPRRLRRSPDGRLFDLDERRTVTMEELVENVRAGRTFRAHRRHTGEECTNEVLVQILRRALPGPAGWADAGGGSPLEALMTPAAGPPDGRVPPADGHAPPAADPLEAPLAPATEPPEARVSPAAEPAEQRAADPLEPDARSVANPLEPYPKPAADSGGPRTGTADA